MNRRNVIIAGGSITAAALLSKMSFAKNYDEEEAKQNAAVHEWYGNVKSNSNSSCCGDADAYWADKIEAPPGVDYFFVTITDDRVIKGRADWNGLKFMVPSAIIDRKKQGNPTGHNIFFVAPAQNDSRRSDELKPTFVAEKTKDYYDEHDVTMYCFFPNTGI